MLAAGLHEVAAQLREYAAYFEQSKYQKFVEEKYGLRVYKPRLIAIVGRDMKQMTDDQFRRAMTECSCPFSQKGKRRILKRQLYLKKPRKVC